MAVDGRPMPEAGAGVAIRRRRAVITLASATLVVMVIGGTVLASTLGGGADPRPPAGSPSPIVTPPDTRPVGAGHAAIAVPEEWGTNEALCGVPQQDTVVIDVAVIEACGTRRARGVDSVEIWTWPPPFYYHADETTVIDGVPAERQKTVCAPDLGGQPVCAGTIYLRSLGVMFIAESSTSRAEVDRILGWIRIVPGLVGVPGVDKIRTDEQGGARATYVDVLDRAGLTAEIHTRTVPGSPAGYILDVSPPPGTMVRPGTVVTVTVVAEPRGPADEVDVGINSVHYDLKEVLPRPRRFADPRRCHHQAVRRGPHLVIRERQTRQHPRRPAGRHVAGRQRLQEMPELSALVDSSLAGRDQDDAHDHRGR
jgi:PASTA domain